MHKNTATTSEPMAQPIIQRDKEQQQNGETVHESHNNA